MSMIHANLALQRLGTANADAKTGRKPHNDHNTHGSVPTMLSLSLARGIASRSDPYNGKVAKGGFIEGAPTPAFAMLGVNAETVTCAAISKDGSAIVW
jgi:hypothetical protein